MVTRAAKRHSRKTPKNALARLMLVFVQIVPVVLIDPLIIAYIRLLDPNSEIAVRDALGPFRAGNQAAAFKVGN
jgi:hypothetical protein